MTGSKNIEPHLDICLFGPFAVQVQGRPLPALRTRKGQWLLALLALRHERAVERAWLAATLWPNVEDHQALFSLRVSLADLRRSLGSQAYRLHSPSPRTLSLDVSAGSLDVAAFDEALAQEDPSCLSRAVALYRGPLLEGCTEEWVFPERAAREEACLNALDVLAAQAAGRGDHGEAARLLHRVVSMDPLRESAHCGLMKAFASGGDFAAVERQYRNLRVALRREVNAEPSEGTVTLYRTLRAAGRTPAQGCAVGPDTPPTRRLPCPLTRLIGRETEVDAVSVCLRGARLTTLTGSGGVGKTRLAIAVAEQTAAEYADGVWFVDLAPLSDASLVPNAVASALGVREAGDGTLLETLQRYLRTKSLLIVLDNCEHLVAACARLAEALLASGAGVRILATSRETLRLAGEVGWRVPSLAVPSEEALPAGANHAYAVQDFAAIELFVHRALQADPKFRLTAANARATAAACRHLDGIPLAIELAAARVRSLSLEEINARLGNCFRLLTGGSRTALPRQQTLRALIDWSYDLLNGQEKTLLCRLSVFAGGWTLEAAEQVGVGSSTTEEGIEEWEMLDLLTSLADKSLVLAQTQEGATRYRLLETVRQYARDRLVESGESLGVRARHGDYFLTLADEIKPKLNGSEQGQWLGVLEEEHDNLRQALTLYTEDAEAGEKGLRLGAALQQFWRTRGHLSEGRERLGALLAHPGGQECTKARADALNGAGSLAWLQGDYGEARVLYEESLAIARELGDKRGIAISLGNLGLVADEQGDYSEARVLYEESLTIRRELGDKSGISNSLTNLGDLAQAQGDYSGARVLLEESLTIQRELGDKRGIAYSLNNLGSMAAEQGDYSEARVLYEESLTIRRELGDKSGIAASLVNLGLVAAEQGDYSGARVLLEESLAIARELGAKAVIADGLEAFASVALHETDEEQGARLWGAAAALREAIGSPLPPAEREKQERERTMVRETLGEAAFAAAWAQGQAMTMEQAIEYALEEGVA